MIARVLLALAVLTACDRGEPLRRADGSLLSTSGGEVSLSDGSRLRFTITSDRYKQWDAARSALRHNVAARFGALLKPRAPTERSIAAAVRFLETDVTSREAIERTGMSVRDFVLMTVALEQEMQLASRAGAEIDDDAESRAVAVAPFMDSLYAPRPGFTDSLGIPGHSDTMADPQPYVDTMERWHPSPYVDTSTHWDTSPDTVRRRDTVRQPDLRRRSDSLRRPDSLIPRLDTVIPPRDTSRPWPDTSATT